MSGQPSSSSMPLMVSGSLGHLSARVGDAVLVVVGIGAAVVVFEAVLVLGLVGALVVVVGDAVLVAVGDRRRGGRRLGRLGRRRWWRPGLGRAGHGAVRPVERHHHARLGRAVPRRQARSGGRGQPEAVVAPEPRHLPPDPEQHLDRCLLRRAQRVGGAGRTGELCKEGEPIVEPEFAAGTEGQLVVERDVEELGGRTRAVAAAQARAPSLLRELAEEVPLDGGRGVVGVCAAVAPGQRDQQRCAQARPRRRPGAQDPRLGTDAGVAETGDPAAVAGRDAVAGLEGGDRDQRADLEAPAQAHRQLQMGAHGVADEVVGGLARALDGRRDVDQHQRLPGVVEIEPRVQLPAGQDRGSVHAQVAVRERRRLELLDVDRRLGLRASRENSSRDDERRGKPDEHREPSSDLTGALTMRAHFLDTAR